MRFLHTVMTETVAKTRTTAGIETQQM